jgi:Ca2+-binding RTX toxin-like protein
MRPAVSFLTLVLVLTVVSAATAKRITGNGRDNTLIGTQARDTIFGRGGNDVLSGRGGRDTIDGQAGNDVVVGGRGADTLLGRGLDDTIDGGPRGDVISPGFGPDVVSGGGGNDVILAHDRDERLDSIDCGPGRDRAVIRRGDRAFRCETIVRWRGPRLSGRYEAGTSAGDQLHADFGAGQRDLLAGLNGDDDIHGFAGNDVLWGDHGHDLLQGGYGGDWLIGGPGNDRLHGGRGLDRLWGGPGMDRLDGNDPTGPNPVADDGQQDLLFAVEDDRQVDTVVCGAGDRAVVRRGDVVANRSLCARVRVLPPG